MSKFIVMIRVFFESLLLWLGSVAFYLVMTMFFYGPIEDNFGMDAGHLFYGLLALAEVSLLIWIIRARRKEMGERISTLAYAVLHILPFVLVFYFCWAYAHSFD